MDGEKGGKGVWRRVEREVIYLSPHCHHQRDFCIKVGSNESHFNVSLIVRDKDHNFWREKRAEADSNRGPSAYQPNALPLGQTGSHGTRALALHSRRLSTMESRGDSRFGSGTPRTRLGAHPEISPVESNYVQTPQKSFEWGYKPCIRRMRQDHIPVAWISCSHVNRVRWTRLWPITASMH